MLVTDLRRRHFINNDEATICLLLPVCSCFPYKILTQGGLTAGRALLGARSLAVPASGAPFLVSSALVFLCQGGFITLQSDSAQRRFITLSRPAVNLDAVHAASGNAVGFGV